MSDDKRTRLAVLIDGDNASPRQIELILIEIAKIGEAVVRRVYGDFSSPGLRGWGEVMGKHAITPMQTFSPVKGKNASDIALVIDAMDLMHSGNYDGFFLISSDSDFTRLAQRLRESGAEIYGVGETKTPEAFRQSCRRFFFVENLEAEMSATDEPELTLPRTEVLTPRSAVPLILRAYEKHRGDSANGWAPIRAVRRTILNIDPAFDERSYNHHRLGDLASATGRFELRETENQGWLMREKAPKQDPAHKPTGRRPQTKPRTAPVADDGLRRTAGRGIKPTGRK